jgi:hypothetical protein
MRLSTWSGRIAIAAAILAAFAPDAMAETPVSADQSMADFIKSNPDCLEFTDECSICAMVAGKPACSTPRIACIRKAYICTRGRER